MDPARDSVDEFIKLLIHPPHQSFQSPHTLSHTHPHKKHTLTQTHTYTHTHTHTPALNIYDKSSKIKTTKPFSTTDEPSVAETPFNLAELHYCAQESPFNRTAVHTLVVSAMAQWKVPSPTARNQEALRPRKKPVFLLYVPGAFFCIFSF